MVEPDFLTIWCGAISTEQRSLGEANWRIGGYPCRVPAPAPFACDAPRQINHCRRGTNIPGENGDLNHGVVLVMFWSTSCTASCRRRRSALRARSAVVRQESCARKIAEKPEPCTLGVVRIS